MRVATWLTGIALVGWIVGMSIWHSQQCCGAGETVAMTTSTDNIPCVVKDGVYFQAEATKSVCFVKNEAQPIVFQETKAVFASTSEYLQQNPLKKLVITGLVADGESKSEALGLDRANAIRDILINRQQVQPTQIDVRSAKREGIKKVKDTLIGALEFEFLSVAPLLIKDDATGFEQEIGNNTTFRYGSYNLANASTKELSDGLAKVAGYLNTKSNRKLLLTGLSVAGEPNSSALANIGIARANQVKSMLIALGANATQLETASAERGDLPKVDSAWLGAVEYEFVELSDQEAKNILSEFRDIEKDLTRRPQRLHFGKMQGKLKIDEKLRIYFKNLMSYLDAHPRSKAYCVGYTDDVGTAMENLELGKERAGFVKQYFQKHGVRENQVVALSRGEQNALASNSTENGKQLNRRVEIHLSIDGSQPNLVIKKSSKDKKEDKEKKEDKDKKDKDKNEENTKDKEEEEDKKEENTPKKDSLK
ncbi:MAG: OmpA family protein [Aureispira sp.]|nr:OmpA family protein [Aureispira sp.]